MEQTEQAFNSVSNRRQPFHDSSGATRPDIPTIARAMKQAGNSEFKSVRFKTTSILPWVLSAVFLVGSAALAWKFWPANPAKTVELKTLEIAEGEDSGDPIEPQTNPSTTTDLAENLAALTVRADVLDDSITRLEDKLARVHELVNSMIAAAESGTKEQASQTSRSTDEELEVAQHEHAPSEEFSSQTQPTKTSGTPTAPESALGASGDSDTATVMSKNMQETALGEVNDPGAAESGEITSGQQPSAKLAKGGAWVINVASLQDKAAAENYAARIRSRNIPVEVKPANRTGIRFWRIQVVDFATAEEARSYADSVRDELGLKEVWITRR